MYIPYLDKVNIGFIGITAALAYRLPSDPIDLNDAFNQALDGDGLLDRVEDQQQKVQIQAADKRNATDFARRPVDSYYNPQNQQSDSSKPDRYYTNPQSMQSQQNFASVPNRDRNPSVGNYPKNDRYYSQPPPSRFFEYGGQMPGPPEPGVIDKFTNKMDYYFSYADKMLKNFRDMASKRVDPVKEAPWNGGRPMVSGEDDFYR